MLSWRGRAGTGRQGQLIEATVRMEQMARQEVSRGEATGRGGLERSLPTDLAAHDPQNGAIALSGVGNRRWFGRGWRLGPTWLAQGRGVRAIRRVFDGRWAWAGEWSPRENVAATRSPLNFNGGGGEFRVDSFIDEAAGDAVIMEID
ncbi:MAG: hypothetical protein IPN19_00295 [Elusimicrobia bacterium]|nr:hypothetical protein [Elusimicrobiota bacterium]